MGFEGFLHVLFAPDSFLQLFSSCGREDAIKRIVSEQDHMEKIQIAIAVPNRSLIFTELNHTLIVGSLNSIFFVAIHNKKRPGESYSNY